MKHDDVLLMQFEACRFSARIRLRSTRNNGNVNLGILSDVGGNGVGSNEHQLVLAALCLGRLMEKAMFYGYGILDHRR